MTNKYLKRGIILFWALWFTIVTCSDFTSCFLQVYQLIPDTFPFNSRNYDLIAQFLLVYGSNSHFFQQGIALITLLWTALIAFSFWLSFFKVDVKFAYFAFNFSFSMTAFFILVDECFIKYEIEHGHLIRLSVQLLTFLIFMQLTTTKKAL